MFMQVKSLSGSNRKFSRESSEAVLETYGSAAGNAPNAGSGVFSTVFRHLEAYLPSLSHGPEYLYALQRLALSDRGRPA